MSIDLEGRRPRIYRGIEQIRQLYNAHAAAELDPNAMYKFIDRARRQGVELVGHDGARLICEEAKFLDGLLKLANAT
jgi:hypothetical protein